jgi:hypothetical protein
MSLSTTMIALARKQLEDKGRAVTLQRVTEGAYDVTDGTVGAATTVNYSAYGLPDGYNSLEVDGTSIRNSDVKLWLSTPTTGEVPAVGDTATIDSVVHRIVNVGKIVSQGYNLIYELQCRI